MRGTSMPRRRWSLRWLAALAVVVALSLAVYVPARLYPFPFGARRVLSEAAQEKGLAPLHLVADLGPLPWAGGETKKVLLAANEDAVVLNIGGATLAVDCGEEQRVHLGYYELDAVRRSEDGRELLEDAAGLVYAAGRVEGERPPSAQIRVRRSDRDGTARTATAAIVPLPDSAWTTEGAFSYFALPVDLRDWPDAALDLPLSVDLLTRDAAGGIDGDWKAETWASTNLE